MYQQNLVKLYESQSITDFILIIEDEIKREILNVHTAILYLNSPYFQSIFDGNFKEKFTRQLIIKVADSKAASDVIKSFYGINSEPTIDWRYILNKCLFQLYIGITMDIPLKIEVPENDFEEFHDLIEKIGYNEKTIKLIARNIPKKYDLTRFPKNFLQEIHDVIGEYRVIFQSTSQLYEYDSDTESYVKKIIVEEEKPLFDNDYPYFKHHFSIYCYDTDLDKYYKLIEINDIIMYFYFTENKLIIVTRDYTISYAISTRSIIDKINIMDIIDKHYPQTQIREKSILNIESCKNLIVVSAWKYAYA